MGEYKRCSICNRKFSEYGNNPTPFLGSKCCDDCNKSLVIPMRIYESISDPKTAILFTQDGTVMSVKPKDEYFTLKELQSLVGGLIELYPLRVNNHLVVCNEEGMILNLRLNSIFRKYTNISLVGDVLLCPESIFEEPEGVDDE